MNTRSQKITFLVFFFTSVLAPLLALTQPQPDGTYKSEGSIALYGGVPKLNGSPVHDEAKVLSEQTVQQLEGQLKNFSDSTPYQIFILVIPESIMSLDSYTERVISEWKLGAQSILILVDIKEHEMKFDVGDGLDSVLNIHWRSIIMVNDMKPRFKENNYDAGLTAGVSAINKVIRGTYADPTDKYPWPVIAMLGVYGIAVLVSVLALFIPEKYTMPAFALTAPFHFIFSYMTGIWWVIIVFLITFPLLRYLIIKSKMNLIKLNINPGKHEEDSGDRMIRDNYLHDSSSSDSSDDSSSSERDSSGRW